MTADMNEVPKPDAETEATQEAERIVSEGEEIRERVRNLVVETIREHKLGLDRLGALSREVVDGAVAGVRSAVPEDRESTFRQVFDGLDEAFSTAANATRLALEEARGRGETLAKEDLEKAAKDLGTLETMLVDTVGHAAKRTGDEMAQQLRNAFEHVRRTGTSVRPSVEAAMSAAREHPLTFTREAAAAGVDASLRTAGYLMHTMSGFLAAAGDLLSGEGKKVEGETDRDPEAE